ncbi:hypothetical protein QFC20_003125 [Naganishia adeliensis]|uniref:Uncharacterized protein n=1 Tax=Naganishia adeliensis TaxID=92952 RepID=A0ACC2WGU3_9TREE|nr:hypothetical protein QFC20_003125 [Naganishia adeliensis]
MSNPSRFEMDYHYQNVDPAIGDKIDDEIRNLFNSSTQDGDRKDIREELTEKSSERVVDVYQKAIMDAYKIVVQLRYQPFQLLCYRSDVALLSVNDASIEHTGFESPRSWPSAPLQSAIDICQGHIPDTGVNADIHLRLSALADGLLLDACASASFSAPATAQHSEVVRVGAHSVCFIQNSNLSTNVVGYDVRPAQTPGDSLSNGDISAIAQRNMLYRIPHQYKFYYEDFSGAIRDRITPMLKGLRHFIVSEENTAKHKELVARCVKRIVEIYQIAAAESGNCFQSHSVSDLTRDGPSGARCEKDVARACEKYRRGRKKTTKTYQRRVDLVTPLRKALKDPLSMVAQVGTELANVPRPYPQGTVRSLTAGSADYSQGAQAVSFVGANPNFHSSLSDYPETHARDSDEPSRR